MLMLWDGLNKRPGFPRYVSADEWEGLKYEGFSGESVFWPDDDWGLEPLGYDLPRTHIMSAWFVQDCAYCGCAETIKGAHALDHIVPFKHGGSHLQRDFCSADNRAPACDKCNRSKSDKIGLCTLDGRYGVYWDGSLGDTATPPPKPRRIGKGR